MHLSIAIPAPCGNRCAFCIANMQEDTFESAHCNLEGHMDQAYTKRMSYAKELGCNSLTLTGEGEPLLNRNFLRTVGRLNATLPSPFHHIQIQTSGMTLTAGMGNFLKVDVGVSVVGLSLCHFDSVLNARYTRPQNPEYLVLVDEVCQNIIDSGLTLRVCLNLTDILADWNACQLLSHAEMRGASQVTFRELYVGDTPCVENRWIAKHRASAAWVSKLREYIHIHGRPLPKLGHGLEHYSLSGMSVVIDSDCMTTSDPAAVRSLVLRDGKLYSRWDDRGSLIF